MPELNPHETANRAYWDAQSDRYQERHGEQLINSGRNAWGLWQRPESELEVLGDVAGRDVLEFGCGAAQWSIALAERGARVTGLDLSERQLAHARELMLAAGMDFPLVCASAEATPFDDRSFDIVFCDWGAMTFADPYRTVPEAARVLRTGGLFAFCGGAPIVDCAWAPGPITRASGWWSTTSACTRSASPTAVSSSSSRTASGSGSSTSTVSRSRRCSSFAPARTRRQLPRRVRSRLGAALADGAHLAAAPDRLSGAVPGVGVSHSGAAGERVDRLPAGHTGEATGQRRR